MGICIYLKEKLKLKFKRDLILEFRERDIGFTSDILIFGVDTFESDPMFSIIFSYAFSFVEHLSACKLLQRFLCFSESN